MIALLVGCPMVGRRGSIAIVPSSWRLVLALCVVLCAIGTAKAESSKLYDIDLPAQSVADALNGLSEQTAVPVVFPYDLARDRKSNPVKGRLTLLDALDALLRGTGLSGGLSDKGVVTISRSRSRTPYNSGETQVTQNENTGSIASGVQAAAPKRAPIAALFASIAATFSASAQETATPPTQPAGLEEIVVTAQKRTERLQDVPISISVLNGAALDSSTVDGVMDALRGVPGVAPSVNVFGGSSNVSIRGVSAAGPLYFGSSPVAYYVDSVPFGLVKSAISPDSSAYDLQRVEVLRGPQGTLYGASAQAGVVRVLTNDPVMNEFDFKERDSISDTEYGSVNYRTDTAVNIPIVDDKLAARAVIGYENDSGWIDRPDQSNANDASLLNIRLKIAAQPTDELSIGLSGWSSRSNYGALSYSPNNRNIDFLNDEPVHTDFDAYGAKVGYRFPTFELTSATSYLDYHNDFYWETAAPPNDALLYTINGSHVFTQEIYLASTIEGPWRWTAGGSYRDGKDQLYQALPFYDFYEDEYDISKSYAVFGELTRKLTDRLELTGGLRYFHEVVTDGEYFSDAPPAPPISASSAFHKVSPRGVLSWRASDSESFYASYSEGFRSGGNQDPATLHSGFYPPFRPDNLKNYEVGTKGTLWQGRVTFDTSVYYMDWQHVQQLLTVPVPGIPNFNNAEIINGQSASGVGVDFATTIQVTDALTVGINFSWNDLTEDAAVVAHPSGAPGGVVVFAKGDRLNLSPEDTAGATADYQFPIASTGYKGHLSGAINFVSSQYYRRLVGTGVDTTPGENITMGRVAVSTISPGGHWTTSLYVDDVNNEQNAVFLHWTDVPQRNLYVRPRTFGLQVEYKLR